MTAVPAAAPLKIWMPLRGAIILAALVDLLVGLVFLIGPELGFTLWPSPVGSTISRFIGAIIFANGIGALMVAWNGGWEHARVLFTVSLLYGLLVLFALPLDLIVYGKDTVLWAYVAVDAVFLLPIAAAYLGHEYLRWKQRRAK